MRRKLLALLRLEPCTNRIVKQHVARLNRQLNQAGKVEALRHHLLYRKIQLMASRRDQQAAVLRCGVVQIVVDVEHQLHHIRLAGVAVAMDRDLLAVPRQP